MSVHFADHGQAVLTPICAVRRATTGDCDPVYGGCRCGLLYFLYSTKKSHTVTADFATVTGSPVILAVWSHRLRQFTQSQIVFGRTHIVTLVATLCTVCIGVSTP